VVRQEERLEKGVDLMNAHRIKKLPVIEDEPDSYKIIVCLALWISRDCILTSYRALNTSPKIMRKWILRFTLPKKNIAYQRIIW